MLVYSILLYGFSAFAAGFATSVEWLLFWRCCTFVGVCVEFVAAVAWLSELFTDPKQREHVLGYTQAFSSIGGVMVSTALLSDRHLWPPAPGGSWRARSLALHADVGCRPGDPADDHPPVPARVPRLAEKKRAGTLKRPSFGLLFQPEFRRTTIVTTVMMACAYAAAFGAIQQMPRIVPGLAEVQALGAHGAGADGQRRVSRFRRYGGLAGRIVLAYLAVVIISRRRLLHVFQVPGLILMPIVFLLVPTMGLTMAQWGAALVGFMTIAQFSFWGNYLPRVYPTHLRGTGESFAANVGGRMIGTFAAQVTVWLSHDDARAHGAHQAGVCVGDRGHRRVRHRLRRQASSCRSRRAEELPE